MLGSLPRYEVRQNVSKHGGNDLQRSGRSVLAAKGKDVPSPFRNHDSALKSCVPS